MPAAKKKAAKKPPVSVPVAPATVAPRIARRERRRDQSREEIVEGARRVLMHKGMAATTIEAVAEEVGLTKAAIYYYFPSKDALMFEVMFGIFERHAHGVHDAVAEAKDGGAALRAVIRRTMRDFATNLDDFRLVFLQNQVAGTAGVQPAAEQFLRLRPLNDLAYAGAAKKLADDWKRERGRAHVDPRLMTFLANVATLGVLTMKGMVEQVGDPLRYTDEELMEGLSRIFEAAARP